MLNEAEEEAQRKKRSVMAARQWGKRRGAFTAVKGETSQIQNINNEMKLLEQQLTGFVCTLSSCLVRCLLRVLPEWMYSVTWSGVV